MYSTRPSESRSIGRIAVGLASTIYLYSCATRPPPPPPVTPIIIAPALQPVATPTPESHLTKASWYGPGFAGRKTTSGERFNPRGLTAASKTLPIGAVVKVTNPQNGKSVNVRINDRGPFVAGRSLDLSQRAAEKIGIIHKGVARVKVTRAAARTPAQSEDAKNDVPAP